MSEPQGTGKERSSTVVNGHSIGLDGFAFVCQNDDCELEEQSYAVVRHAASEIDCPVEQIEDGGASA